MSDTKALLDKEKAELKKMIAEHRAYLDEKVSANVDTVPKLMYDPFDIRQDFLGIIGEIDACDEYANGAVVKWINPELRNRSSAWSGWEPMCYGDAYTGENGELLSQYITAAPMRMQRSGPIDNYVRRSDLILCRLDKSLWIARGFNREARNALQRAKGSDSLRHTKPIQHGVSLTGEGMTDSKRPDQGFRIGEENRAPALPATTQDAEHAERGGVFRTEMLPKKE
jgi:hypothetical protein